MSAQPPKIAQVPKHTSAKPTVDSQAPKPAVRTSTRLAPKPATASAQPPPAQSPGDLQAPKPAIHASARLAPKHASAQSLDDLKPAVSASTSCPVPGPASQSVRCV